MSKLTDAKAKGTKPRAMPYKLCDGDGLYLLITPITRKLPSGGRYWRYKYRFAGKEQTHDSVVPPKDIDELGHHITCGIDLTKSNVYR